MLLYKKRVCIESSGETIKIFGNFIVNSTVTLGSRKSVLSGLDEQKTLSESVDFDSDFFFVLIHID